jgi:hypothetical protein
LSINRALGGQMGDLPELSLASLQQALAEDEALIAYFWDSVKRFCWQSP